MIGKYQHGQGLLEFMLALSVLSILLTTAIANINDALNQQHTHLGEMRSVLFQLLPDDRWQPHESDAFSQRVTWLTSSFEYLVDVDFPTNNLKSVSHEQSPYVMARLTHAWPAESELALTQRPAKLTATYHLNQLGVGSVLDVVSVVPLVKELKSESLQLGKVDADVVPESAQCDEQQCL